MENVMDAETQKTEKVQSSLIRLELAFGTYQVQDPP